MNFSQIFWDFFIGDRINFRLFLRDLFQEKAEPGFFFILVPVDVLVFSPSYVPEDKLPETAQSKLNTKKRRFIQDAQGGAASSTELPSVPTAEFFNQISRNPALKTAICENTFHTVASKNNEIYGLETRANEVFLKESLSMGHVSVRQNLNFSRFFSTLFCRGGLMIFQVQVFFFSV
jgi:hypothetical protein